MNTTVMETSSSTLATTPVTDFVEPHVVVRGSGRNFIQQIAAGDHQFQADEPKNFGGSDTAPDPHDYLMASLGACTSMMVGLQARNRKWPLEEIIVSLRHSRVHAKDCDECLTKDGMIDRIDIGIELIGELTPEQRAELMKTARNCPIHRALTHEINVRLRTIDSDS